MTLLFQLLDKLEVQKNYELHNCLEAKLNRILALPDTNAILSNENDKVFKLAKRLLSVENAMSPSVMKATIQLLQDKTNVEPNVALRSPIVKVQY